MTEVNLFDVDVTNDEDDPDGYNTAYVRVGPLVGGEQLGLSRLRAGAGPEHLPVPLRERRGGVAHRALGPADAAHAGRRAGAGPWDCAFFPTGEAGAHKVTNRTDEPSACDLVEPPPVATSVYPDSDKVGAWPPGKLFRLADAVDYWDGELSAARAYAALCTGESAGAHEQIGEASPPRPFRRRYPSACSACIILWICVVPS